jgi:alpha-glucosidase
MNLTWWDDAVVYQVYLRSFADADGDGIGDLAGLHARLGYLADLGVDAIWVNPFYLSPQRDHGYDIADYFSIDPVYGSIAELVDLVGEAHRLGVRVLIDMVANHCSDQHAWFKDALAGEEGGPERERFLFRDGRGESRELPPNNWQSVFGGPAWTRITEPDGSAGQWYYHAFDSSQPDFNWRAPEVARYFEDVLSFWYGCGVDGFRIDVAHGLFKSAEMADWAGAEDATGGHNFAMWDQPEVHDIYRAWRRIGDSYSPSKYYIGEIWVPGVDSLVPYLAADELHQGFSFDLLVQPWDAHRMGDAIDRGLAQGRVTGSAPAWTLSNHDVHRPASRYGQAQDLSIPDPSDMLAAARRTGAVDALLGVRRARAAAMLQLALPGSTFLYQGEELGLLEVFDLPDEARQDPIWLRSGGAELGRDGCRVPLPWSTGGTPFGFSDRRANAAPWLPQPEWFEEFAVDLQEADPLSTLNLYRMWLRRRRDYFPAGSTLEWLDLPTPDMIAFSRGTGVCVVNFGATPAAIPACWDASQIIGSAPIAIGDDGPVVPANSAAWLVSNASPATKRLADGVFKGSPFRNDQLLVSPRPLLDEEQ